ncbi:MULTISPECIES: EamA family transporter [unclassified Devosia]|uniref:EamA family transporter n=1 Tax=unclassified Devosia TaxID=196773 RepID=UPI0023D87687|nr:MULTISPECIES: EamA family transporter [unclassified Devosia]WEJ33639.1 EamA family transporter [Devosia sp. SD17-2]
MRPNTLLVPVLLVTLGMVFTATGSSFAKMLFPLVGAAGATALRLTLAALVLIIVFRPWRHALDGKQKRAVLLYGVAMGSMNLFFYAAISLIPLGLAVALEFTGPLAVALFGARRPLDFFWIILAVAGFALLLPWAGIEGDVSLIGIVLALCAGACWAGYIVFGQRAGTGGGPHTAALGVGTAAVIALPFGIAEAGTALLDVSIWPLALAVALLSSAIPYALDMVALPKIPSRLFGILMSGQPALAALSGLVILGERLSPLQLAGMAAIIFASIGATATIARPRAETEPGT